VRKVLDTFKSQGGAAAQVASAYYGPVIENFDCDKSIYTAVEVTAGNRQVIPPPPNIPCLESPLQPQHRQYKRTRVALDAYPLKFILCLHDLPSLSPKLRYFARSGPPFVIRSVLIGWGCPGLQMVDLSERENGLWGRERGDSANIE